ncbi:concanavalin A-like lectin/glucanase [Sodiomyces alkalinus F11]|uniref:Concanavalin A-like lectin/glucanase n=1 Tax=Sodiomyces alkalinus (strain CBS 110278 / VKM F-3762 / F11) TaxID=1314773 RepID=A0A3N2PWZ2_SODAK|nr:concanavalin A-like lectin/glucanase [Sodiomyces alkalinus F11]ROT38855.1 concanavalin A-like lectin/glucanase [Sodiomyces alkalinus F11]
MNFFWALCLTGILRRVSASEDCDCGYAAKVGNSRHVFTDLIETDFGKVASLSRNADWFSPEFNRTGDRVRGPLGEQFSRNNVDTVVEGSGSDQAPGLRMFVRNSTVDGMVPVAEVDSTRQEIQWGSFRVSMQVPDVAGTCAAFFWYHNDTQEIDLEFLTKEFDPGNNTFPLNLVVHSLESQADDYDPVEAGSFVKVQLPFNPTTAFHEYRFDYLPGRIIFYADGDTIAEMDGPGVPTAGGHLILQHWSSGNPLWSGGPPTEDAVLNIRYVKAYFNSSSVERREELARGCTDSATQNVCDIPNDEDFFFNDQDSDDQGGQNGGDDGGPEDSTNHLYPLSTWGILAASLAATFCYV